jgi:hypothetical protein
MSLLINLLHQRTRSAAAEPLPVYGPELRDETHLLDATLAL